MSQVVFNGSVFLTAMVVLISLIMATSIDRIVLMLHWLWLDTDGESA